MDREKIILLIIFIISIFTFTACNNQFENSIQNNLIETSGDNSKTESIYTNKEDKKFYIFIMIV